MNANWNYPTSVRIGPGRIHELADTCGELKIKAPLIVTDPGLAALPMIQSLNQYLQDFGLNCQVFYNIKSNPTGDNVDEGVQVFRDGKHDGVIAFGGGSALDAGKAIAFMSGQYRPIWDFEDVGDNWSRANVQGIAPIIAVPTTAGTGSEVGRASVITDSVQQVKKIIFHPQILPTIVILDPELTLGLPAHLTAATGMDALSHNLEAFCSPFEHPMAAGIAVEGIRLVKEFLPTAVKEPDHLEARTQMLVASSMGATAFQKGLGGMHALAHPLGACYDAHHGMLNAILMPYVLVANASAIQEPLGRVARYIGLEKADFTGFVEWVLSLRESIGIPHSLDKIGIDAQQAEKIGQMAVEDPSASGNPIQFTAKQYEDLLVHAVRGNLEGF